MSPVQLQRIFSSNLKRLRVKAHLSQMKLAEKANLSVGYICDLESERRWGTPETFSKLSSALEVNPFELLLPVDTEENAQKEVLADNGVMRLALIKQRLEDNIGAAISNAINDTFDSIYK